MDVKQQFTAEQLHYLRLLAKQYPTVHAAGTEIIKLQQVMNLPKGTEHFLSDIHGEHEAFLHILNACSGEVKAKLTELFADTLSQREQNQLATLIYYPAEVLAGMHCTPEDFTLLLHRLVLLCRFVSVKYTRSRVRQAIDESYREIIDELLHLRFEDEKIYEHYQNILSTIVKIDQAEPVIRALCRCIKQLTVDHLHIVGDIFDRGPRADIVMDSLMQLHSVDIQWGNHDILWMGAASGSRTLVATVLSNSLHYHNLDVIETGYGISLRPLSIFANEVYANCDTHCFEVKLTGDDADRFTEKDKLLCARMYKAITMILFKLEGQKLLCRPQFGMTERLLLDKIDYETKTVCIGGKVYPMEDCDFPTVDPGDPYALTPEESAVIDQLTDSFRHSEKLQRHVRFLFSKGSLYKVHNGNLLFHGCIPLDEKGELMTFTMDETPRKGRDFLDFVEKTCRKGSFERWGTPQRQFGMDFMWWLWAGRNSPIFGRDKMTTFERRFIKDESTWAEPKNAYYTYCNEKDTCEMLLQEFGLVGHHCHIINGHVPVKAKKGESPIKGGGKLIVIDGGFCKAYQSTSGIAGYTLIYNSRNYRIVSHQKFEGRRKALTDNHDIANHLEIFETMEQRVKVSQTDQGKLLQQRVDDLLLLLTAFRSGAVAEDHES